MSLDTEQREAIREALRTPGWYVLLRTPSGFRRIAVTPSDEWTDDGECSGMISVDVEQEVLVWPDELVAGFPVTLGTFHPELHPDPEERGTPLPA